MANSPLGWVSHELVHYYGLSCSTFSKATPPSSNNVICSLVSILAEGVYFTPEIY